MLNKSQLNLLDNNDNSSLVKLCCNLAYSDTEKSVIKLLSDAGYWDDDSCWRYYGDNENNFATIGNQQSRPESALVEKIINSVDAVLMAECLKRRIDPESNQAPKDINTALVEYFNIFNGKLSNILASERSKLAENIMLVATGKKNNPCYSIIDIGEGQSGDKIPDTFLSLVKSNKLRIPFVQGKFNMGGTGVLRFCGKNNLQLIISKRHPKLQPIENKNSSGWSFTVIRREEPKYLAKSSVYKYLAPKGKTLTFISDGLPLLPKDYPEAFGNELKWGTFIKLFEYQMTGLKTNILFDLYNRLSLLMPAIALPVRLFERRKGYAGHSFETTLAGITVRLEDDKRENLESGFPSSSPFTVMGHKMTAQIFAFKKGQSEKYSKDEGIVFNINGQAHGFIPKSFFVRRKRLRLGYIYESILILVDCSNLDHRSREDLFMNSRDRLSNIELRTEILKSIEDILKNHQGLIQLNMRRREEEIKNKLSDSKPLVEILERILEKSPTLSKLFIKGQRLSNPFNIEIKGSENDFIGRRFPTFFTLIKKHPISSPKNCHIGSQFRIQFSTDADNDYFERDSEKGNYEVTCDDMNVINSTLNLWQGIATLSVFPPQDSFCGQILHYSLKVSDNSRVEPFLEDFYISLLDPSEKIPGGKGKR